jgi:hypothetical protein
MTHPHFARLLTILFLSGPVLVSAACGGGDQGSATSAPAEPPHRVIFVYDRSTSIMEHELNHYRELTNQQLLEMDHGDRLVAMELLQLSLTEAPKRWSQDVPAREFEGRAMPRDSVALTRFLRDARDYLLQFTDAADREDMMGTDILSTIYDVAEEVRAYPGYRTTLVLFSDMLQATRDINMEGMIRFPPADWVERTKAEGRLPDLTGVCVVVAGARIDTPESQRVKDFWMDYFNAAGARLEDRNYALRPPRLPDRPCPGW